LHETKLNTLLVFLP